MYPPPRSENPGCAYEIKMQTSKNFELMFCYANIIELQKESWPGVSK